jgi:inner membrane protein
MTVSWQIINILNSFQYNARLMLNTDILIALHMEPITIAIFLIILGMIFLLVEAFSPGAFMVIPGTVLVILGVIGYVWPDFLFEWYSPVVALIIAVPVTLVTVKGYQLLAKPEPPTTTVTGSLIGRKGMVTVDTDSNTLKGKVKIGSDIWSAVSDDSIEAGANVIVDSSEGVHVHVKRD